jgi:uncharacterized protein YfaQ (DUF2300 family)
MNRQVIRTCSDALQPGLEPNGMAGLRSPKVWACLAGLIGAWVGAATALPAAASVRGNSDPSDRSAVHPIAGAALAWPAAGELQLAWLDDTGRAYFTHLSSAGPSAPNRSEQTQGQRLEASIALGSLWKLVSYARLAESGAQESPYTCTGSDPQEVYCCSMKGERVSRSEALWRSCGLYFEPARVGWSAPTGLAAFTALPPDLAHLRQATAQASTTQVSLQGWLTWLNRWPLGVRAHARDDLLGYWLQGPGRSALGHVGSQLRVKTFTLEGPKGTRLAGASGWTQAGWPVWFAARGTSKDVLPRWAPEIVAFLQTHAPQALANPRDEDACVDVDFFQRYPLADVQTSQGKAAQAGRLANGTYRLRFANGQALEVSTLGELVLHRAEGAAPRITARLPLEDYVARVIDREARPEPAQAARALAIAARTYVHLNGQPRPGAGPCLVIPDSTATQRVAPRPPSSGAREAAAFSASVVLADASAQYHLHQARPGVMAWRNAVDWAQAGKSFDQILLASYPGSSLISASGRGSRDCEPMPSAQAWLSRQRPRWARQLAGQPGYRDPGAVQLCRSVRGLAYVHSGTQRIHTSGIQTLEDRLALTHEFLHLAFAGHPSGRNEVLIETRARQLLGLE